MNYSSESSPLTSILVGKSLRNLYLPDLDGDEISGIVLGY